MYLLRQGCWVGAAIPPGFMIDWRKKLPDDRFNPDYRRFFVFEPIAEVVREYYDLFINMGGCLHRTMRVIENQGPYYPDPTTWQLPPGFRIPEREWRHCGE